MEEHRQEDIPGLQHDQGKDNAQQRRPQKPVWIEVEYAKDQSHPPNGTPFAMARKGMEKQPPVQGLFADSRHHGNDQQGQGEGDGIEEL